MSLLGNSGLDFRKLAEASSIGLVLPASIVVGLVFGYLLDKWLGTRPWMLLLFLILGVVSGFVSLLRAFRKYGKDDGDSQNRPVG